MELHLQIIQELADRLMPLATIDEMRQENVLLPLLFSHSAGQVLTQMPRFELVDDIVELHPDVLLPAAKVAFLDAPTEQLAIQQSTVFELVLLLDRLLQR